MGTLFDTYPFQSKVLSSNDPSILACHLFISFIYNFSTEHCRSEQRRRYGNGDSKTHLTTFDQDSVITVDDAGTVRLWEVHQSQIAKSLTVWQSSVGGNT